MTLTPLHLEILLWHHCRLEPMENSEAPAVIEYRSFLIEHDILWKNSAHLSGFSLTRKGEVWLNALLTVPFPLKHYIMPDCFWR